MAACAFFVGVAMLLSKPVPSSDQAATTTQPGASYVGPPAPGAAEGNDAPAPGATSVVPTPVISSTAAAATVGTQENVAGGPPTIAQKLSGNSEGNMRYDQLRELLQEPKQLAWIISAKIQPDGAATTVENATLTFDDGSVAHTTYDSQSLSLANQLSAAGVKVDVDAPSDGSKGGSFGSMILPLLLVLAFVGGLALYNRKKGIARHNSMAGENNKPVHSPGRVTFADVAGCDEAVSEVAECVDFLTNPHRYRRLGAKLPAGVILYGPPGTGKTLLAKALAGQAEIPFFAVSGSEFVEMYVGVGASRVRELFKKARESEKGAVIFIDEIDAVGGKRTGTGTGGNDEREATLNELLTQMDGFHSTDKVICVGATNRLDMLDPALLRPGRLSRQIAVPLPAEAGRKAILELHTQGKPLADDVDLGRLAKITAGCSGADLAEMVNEAAIMAAREQRLAITERDLEEGHLRALAGPRRLDSGVDEGERKTIAHHEAGHVLCAELCETHEKAQLVTLVPRGSGALGLAAYGRRDRALHSTRYIHEQLVCVLGGRAAEQVIYNVVSSGASNDLEKASDIARQAVETFGFSPKVGQMITDTRHQTSETRKTIIDQEIERLVAEAYDEAVALLTAHRQGLEDLASLLLVKETLDRTEIEAVLGPGLSTVPLSAGAGNMGTRPYTREEPHKEAAIQIKEKRRKLKPVRAGFIAFSNRWHRRSRRKNPVGLG